MSDQRVEVLPHRSGYHSPDVEDSAGVARTGERRRGGTRQFGGSASSQRAKSEPTSGRPASGRRFQRKSATKVPGWEEAVSQVNSAVYAGSFDPITLGHQDIIERSSRMFADVVVAVSAATRNKRFAFDTDERMEISTAGPRLPDPTSGSFKDVKEQWIAAFEKEYIEALLRKNGGNISHASREADIDRKYFRKLMKKYGITADVIE